MSKKFIFSLFFLLSFMIFGESWMDCNGFMINDPNDPTHPNYNDIKYWRNAMKNGLRSMVLRCYPSTWRDALSNFNLAESNLVIKICDRDVDSFNSACAGYNGVLFLRSKSNYANTNGCYCPESTILHELIHHTTGIHDNYNKEIDSCTFRALKIAKVANCYSLPKPPWCDCKDHKNKRSPCKN